MANVVIILADANITGMGDRLFQYAVKQISREALERAVEREIKSAMRSVMREPRRRLTEAPAFRALPGAEKARVLKEMEEETERALYDELEKYASRRADELERTAAKYAGATDELDQHTRKLALENAAAYRRIEEARTRKTGSVSVQSSGKTTSKAARARESKEAERALESNQDFRRWFHREYKADHVVPKGGRTNPDLSPDQVRDAYQEWLESGKPKVK